MTQANLAVLPILAKWLTRRERIYLAWTCKEAYGWLKDCLGPELTDQQREAIDYAVAIHPKFWQNRNHLESLRWPSECIVNPGPSTGKTVIILETMRRLLAQGRRPVYITPPRFLQQVKSVHRQFQDDWHWPKLVVMQAPFSKPSLPVIGNAMLLVPSSISDSTQARLLLAEENPDRLTDALVDDMVAVPMFVACHKFERAILFSATPQTIAKKQFHRTDSQLGRLPASRLSFYSKHVKFQPRTALMSKSNNVAWETALEALEDLPQQLGTKSVIICFDTMVDTSKNDSVYCSLTKNRLPFCTHHIIGTAVQKAQVLNDFQACKTGVLWAPSSYVLRGFDLQCDTLVLLGLGGSMTKTSLVQALGRAFRITSPFREVHVIVYTHHDTFGRTVREALQKLAVKGAVSKDDSSEWSEIIEKPVRKAEVIDWSSPKRQRISESYEDLYTIVGPPPQLFTQVIPRDEPEVKRVKFSDSSE